MDDLISRKALLEALENDRMVFRSTITVPEALLAQGEHWRRCLESAPAVDAVEVVRCGECIYRGSEAHIPGFAYCKLYKCAKDFDGYCDDGERGGNETDSPS